MHAPLLDDATSFRLAGRTTGRGHAVSSRPGKAWRTMHLVSAVAALVCLAGSLARADIIDTFSSVHNGDPDSVAVVTSAASQTIDFTISPTVTDPIGSRRRLEVSQFTQNGSASLTVDGSGVATLASTTGSVSRWGIHYGIGPALNFNALAGGADRFRITFSSFSPLLEYQVIAFSGSGAGTSNAGTWQPVLGNTVDVFYSSFSNLANINFSSLIQIQIRIEDVQTSIPFGSGGSAQITQFETAIPEPGGFVLGGLVLGVLALRRRT